MDSEKLYRVQMCIRDSPGITQAQLREELKIDKGAAARRAASLEAKGYLIRRDNPEDKRSQLLYATKKAEGLKNSKVSIESTFYEWLMEELDESETEHFCEMLDRLYLRSKKESRSGFLQVKERMDLSLIHISYCSCIRSNLKLYSEDG